jgi:hypothetical protein
MYINYIIKKLGCHIQRVTEQRLYPLNDLYFISSLLEFGRKKSKQCFDNKIRLRQTVIRILRFTQQPNCCLCMLEFTTYILSDAMSAM